MNDKMDDVAKNSNHLNSWIIWIDADASPKVIKEIIFKVCARLQCKVIMVANSAMQVPQTPLIELVKVKKDQDAADHYIATHVSKNDIVVTADIPLASLIVAKGAIALDVRGEIYTEENVQQRLSMRDFMKNLRDEGLQTGGPATFSDKDKISFTNALNRITDKKIKNPQL